MTKFEDYMLEDFMRILTGSLNHFLRVDEGICVKYDDSLFVVHKYMEDEEIMIGILPKGEFEQSEEIKLLEDGSLVWLRDKTQEN